MLEDGKSTTRFGLLDRIKGFAHMFGKPNLLKNKTIAAWFYAHPLVKYLGEDNFYSKPAYLTSTNFSKIIIDLLKGFGNTDSNEIQTISNSISNGTIYKLPVNIKEDSNNPAIKAIIYQQKNSIINAMDTVEINTDTSLFLKSLWKESGADVEKFKLKIEQWFDDTMDRASGWYKRYTQYILFIIGFIIAIIFNVDTIAIYKILSKDKVAREQLVQMAIKNKDKFRDTPGQIKEENSPGTEKEINERDSMLNQTYQMVLSDANSANEILGLGRPWKDSCKICSDSIDNKDFNFRFDSLDKKVKIIDTLKMRSEEKKMLSGNYQKMKDSGKLKGVELVKLNNALRLSDSAKRSIDSLLLGYNISLIKEAHSSMNVLKTRCAFIQDQTRGKWFKYSSRQAGGPETFLGWVITALAISLGAPFWFDLLNKLMKLRGSGTKVDSSGNTVRTTTTTSTQSPAPVSVNVNTQTSTEAVG